MKKSYLISSHSNKDKAVVAVDTERITTEFTEDTEKALWSL